MTSTLSPSISQQSEADHSFPRVEMEVILGMNPGTHADALVQQLQADGWAVTQAQRSIDVRQGALSRNVGAVVIEVCFGQESAFLTCAKLRSVNEDLRVILVGPDSEGLARHAEFVGASHYIDDDSGIEALIDAITAN